MEEIAVAKKRGRPSKGGTTGAAPAAGSPIETIPKKRGRPSKAKGGGRPPKVTAVSSDNEDIDHNEKDETNGEQPIKLAGTGKGRGRPRKEPIPVQENSENDDEDAADSSEDKPKKKKQKKARKLGRPRKHQPSDEEENDDEEEERRPVGRPSTGSVNLNIVPSGRGVGRPRKDNSGSVKRSETAASAGSNGDEPPKKRGRPASNKAPYVPSGRPRGRPKANNPSLKDAEEQEEVSAHEDESGEDEEMPAVMSTPKKRGRPSLSDSNKTSTSGKPRGRPKIQKSPGSDGVEQDSATEVDDESNLNVSKKSGRGRPKDSGNKDANGGDADEIGDSSGDDNLSEEPPKSASRKASKSDPKKDNSPDNVEDDADHDNSESVECISDEPSLTDA
ncbi:hypothetical protein ACLKA6_019846 [Drosophila palustris]